jgi:hypothetical protein
MSKLVLSIIGAAGLALVAASANAQVKGEKPFCLQRATSGMMDCSYDTMAQCKKAATGATDNCSPRKSTGDGVKSKK